MSNKLSAFKEDFKDCFLAEFEEPDAYRVIRNLSEDELKKIFKSNEDIFSLLYYERKISEIYFNYDELRKIIDKYTGEVSKMKTLGLDSDFQEEMFININAAFINFVTSFVNFVNSLEQRRYGKHPHLKKAFKARVAAIYDKHFSYKLFYNLRNYALHYNYPIDNFVKNSEISSDGKTYTCQLYINFDREKIIQGEIQKDLRTELKHYNVTFPLSNQLQLFETPLKELISSFWDLERSSFMDNMNEILKLASECNNRYHAIVAKHLEGMSKIDSIILPVKIVERINSKFYS